MSTPGAASADDAGGRLAARWAGLRRLFRQPRRWQPNAHVPAITAADAATPLQSDEPPVGLCRLKGYLNCRIGWSGVVRVEFLRDFSGEALHAVEMPLSRPGQFVGTIYLPMWCRCLRVALRDSPEEVAGEANVQIQPELLAERDRATAVRVLGLDYLGAAASLRFVASDYLCLRPLLHWLVWSCTVRWRRAPRPAMFAAGSRQAYAALLEQVEPDPVSIMALVDAHIARMPQVPCFTVMLDAADCGSQRVQATVDTVTAQLWPEWRLEILGADAGQLSLAHGPRVRFHAADATLEAQMGAVEHGYVVQLRAGDLLSPLALYHLAAEHQICPQAVLIYTDEDEVDADGQRTRPRLKSQWNPEWLDSHDYIGALAAISTRRLHACGGWRAEYGTAAGYDLLLRVTDGQPPECIRHVPVIGCSRPVGSHVDADPGRMRIAMQSRWRHLAGAEVADGLKPGWLRLRRPLPDPAPRVSIIVPTRDGDAHLRVCVDSMLRLTDYADYELILVDNQSRHAGTLAYLAQQARDPRVRVLPFDAAFNFSAICNKAVNAAGGEIVVLLNDDTEVLSADWLREMVSLAVLPDVGAVGAKLYFPDGTIQHAGVALGIGGVAGHVHWGAPRNDDGYLGRLKAVQAVGAVTGACLAVSREKYRAVGGMDEAHLRVALNDIDLCLKLTEQGWRSLWTPYAELVHHESKSRGRDTTTEKRALFALEHATMRQRWQHRLGTDPYYHPWLSRRYLDVRLEDHPAPHWPWWRSESAQEINVDVGGRSV